MLPTRSRPSIAECSLIGSFDLDMMSSGQRRRRVTGAGVAIPSESCPTPAIRITRLSHRQFPVGDVWHAIEEPQTDEGLTWPKGDPVARRPSFVKARKLGRSPLPTAFLSLDVLRGIALFGVMAINVVKEFRVSIFQQFLSDEVGGSWYDRALYAILMIGVDMRHWPCSRCCSASGSQFNSINCRDTLAELGC